MINHHPERKWFYGIYISNRTTYDVIMQVWKSALKISEETKYSNVRRNILKIEDN